MKLWRDRGSRLPSKGGGAIGGPPGMLESAIIVLMLVLYSGGIFVVITIGPPTEDLVLSDAEREGLRLLFLPAYLVTAIFLLSRGRAAWLALKANPLFALVVLMTVVSALWSIDPTASIRRALALVMSGMFGLYLGTRLENVDLLRLLAVALGICMLASAAFALLLPEIGVTQNVHVGAWRGAFTQKNVLGQMALLNILVLGHLVRTMRRHRWLVWSSIGLSAFLIVMADSKTPIVVGAALLGVALLLRLIHRSPRLLVPGLLGLGLVAGGLGLAADPILDLLGRDVTLSGRIQLWSMIWDLIDRRWWLGYGFQAFWVSPLGPLRDLWDRIQWQTPSAHNGFLNVWLDLGFVGFILYVASVCSAVLWCCRWLHVRPYLEVDWLISYFTIFLMFGLVEINLLGPNSLFWVLYVANIAAIGRLYNGWQAVRSRPAGSVGMTSRSDDNAIAVRR